MTNFKNKAGFSLVEVMCATLILGVGIVGLTHGVTTALSSSKESELQTTAALIAAGQIETLRAEGYLMEGDEERACGEPLSLYRWRQSIKRTPIDGLYEVTVVVGHAKTDRAIYELQTLLFDPPFTSTLDDINRPREESPAAKRRNRGTR